MDKNTLKKIIKKGGVTLTSQGLQVNFKKGYQVSFKDCYILEVDNIDIILKKVNYLLNYYKKINCYIGLWIDSNKIYIDLSKKIDNLKNALNFGKSRQQISIFDWNKKECIYL